MKYCEALSVVMILFIVCSFFHYKFLIRLLHCLLLMENSVSVVCQLLHVDVNEQQVVTVLFDAAHSGDLHSCTVDDVLTLTYQEHPHVVSL